jgi:hypothetical protein
MNRKYIVVSFSYPRPAIYMSNNGWEYYRNLIIAKEKDFPLSFKKDAKKAKLYESYAMFELHNTRKL